MPVQVLTEKNIRTAKPALGKSKIDLHDKDTKGLMVEVRNASATYYVRYRDLRGKVRQLKLASIEELTLAQARQKAKEVRNNVAMGIDPIEQRKQIQSMPTVAEFVEQQYMPHIKSYKRSWVTDESLLRNHVLPIIGDLHLDEVRHAHLSALFNKHHIKYKPASTNRIIIIIRYIFNCAKRWGIAGLEGNPADQIPLYTENNKRERYLTPEEVTRLLAQLEASRSPMLKYIIMFLLLTGARKSEVTNAKWDDLDLESRVWKIEFNKTGQTRYVPLSNAAIDLLLSVPVIKDCDYVFANPKTKLPFQKIFGAWDLVRNKAGIRDVRIHDLRHSFASFLVNNGRSLYEVQKILGHTQVKTTQRYAHLNQDSLLKAVNTAGETIKWQGFSDKK
ncbi:tyrosine-type recombinase/integrase [Thiomicrospira microaerophila]|uniref:tyrosine-type recombinase/integrase n=1 Tax=Thiomicrospira microaerophila TaxID=406020 RepID=UPI0005C96712|nr:site-specific integrase [Thiomicrospira microaerophila]